MSEKQPTKKELMEKQEQLKNETARLQKIIDASSETTFEIIIEDLKQQMIENVEQEHWANVKSCIKEVDSIKGTQDFINKQSSLLLKKKDELKEVTDELDNWQPNLFVLETNNNKTDSEQTGVKFNDRELKTGDIFVGENEITSYAIVKSSEIEGKFAIISNCFPDEKLLNYPKNLENLKHTNYIGNIHEDNSNDNDVTLAKSKYKTIEEYRNGNNENGEK